MKRLLIAVLTLLAFVSFTTQVQSAEPTQIETPLHQPAGPFRLKMGMSKQDIEAMTGSKLIPVEAQKNTYIIDKVAEADSFFDMYRVIISPTTGLCNVRVASQVFQNDNTGTALRSKFDQLVHNLDAIYGTSKKINLVLAHPAWTEPKYWMMGLTKKERYLINEWKGQNEVLVQNNLESIYLEANGLNATSGFISVKYYFNNYNSCEKEAN